MTIQSDLAALIGNGLDYNWDSAKAQILEGLDLLNQALYTGGAHTHPASDIVSGTLDNARINWAAPSAIGGTTPAAGTFDALTLTKSSGNATAIINSIAATTRQLIFQTAASSRWRLAVNATAEGGSQAGSDFGIGRFNDAGSFISDAFTIERATGKAYFSGELEIDGDFNHDGSNIGFYGTAPIAKPTVTGSRGGNAALASLCTALANLGLITNSTS